MADKDNKAGGNEDGAKDDWEAIKLVLDKSPALKQRVLHKLREMKSREKEDMMNLSRRAQKDYMRAQRGKKKNKD